MELSVVVPTLNNRERLCSCLDSVTTQLPSDSEVLVVNGPSTDGTTGAVRDRDDVDVLVEISERNRSVSRNAGIERANGDAIAFLGDACIVEPEWYDSIETTLAAGADVVTGPVTGRTTYDEPTKPREIAGRTVAPFSGENVAFTRDAIDELDGFDEYLERGSTLDCAHRVAASGFDVTWNASMAARWVSESEIPDDDSWGERYRSLGYRLSKNYGPRPTVIGRAVGRALQDGFRDARGVVHGETVPTQWIRNGVEVTTNALAGLRDGLGARYRDRSDGVNPHGVSSRHDRAVQVYDRR